MVRSLLASGATVRAYDPTVSSGEDGPRGQLLAGIELVDDPFEVARDAKVLVVATEWPEFAKLDLDQLAGLMAADAVVVDTRNLLDPAAVRAAGLGYDGVGRR
jgi:UDPglucose 6-dehydrogenase